MIMKKMTRNLALVLCAAFCLLALAACGGSSVADSKYIGVWEGTTAEYAGLSLDVSDIFGDFTVEFKDNGKVELTVGDESETGKWEEVEGGIMVDGDEDMTFLENEDGDLYLDYDDVIITFTQQ